MMNIAGANSQKRDLWRGPAALPRITIVALLRKSHRYSGAHELDCRRSTSHCPNLGELSAPARESGDVSRRADHRYSYGGAGGHGGDPVRKHVELPFALRICSIRSNCAIPASWSGLRREENAAERSWL